MVCIFNKIPFKYIYINKKNKTDVVSICIITTIIYYQIYYTSYIRTRMSKRTFYIRFVYIFSYNLSLSLSNVQNFLLL